MKQQVEKQQIKIPINTFQEFYNKQIRKDLIDKLNCTNVQEADFPCTIKFKGYVIGNPADRHFKNIGSVVSAYHYILESFFCQKVKRFCEEKKNKIQRDQPSSFFYFFLCNINKPKLVFDVLQRILISSIFQRLRNSKIPKPYFKFVFSTRTVFLKRFFFSYTPWTKQFRDLENQIPLMSSLSIVTKNPLVFFLIASRLQLYSYISTGVKLQSHSRGELRLFRKRTFMKNLYNLELEKNNKKTTSPRKSSIQKHQNKWSKKYRILLK